MPSEAWPSAPPKPRSTRRPHSLSDPSRQPRWNKQFYVQLAWILVTVLAVCGVLAGTALTGLCHVAENRSDLFYSRCDSPIQYLPLTGLLVLIVGYVIAHLADMPWGARNGNPRRLRSPADHEPPVRGLNAPVGTDPALFVQGDNGR